MIDSEISIKIRLFNSNNNTQDCLLGLRDVMLHKTAIYLYGRSFIVMTIVQLKKKKKKSELALQNCSIYLYVMNQMHYLVLTGLLLAC